MLVALLQERPVDAFEAMKGSTYQCPNCRAEVVLKQGRIVIHHFAHKTPTHCTWAGGETREHLLAKAVIRDAFRARGYKADYEVEVISGAGDRRADVLLTNASGARVAIEIQHTSILYDAIEKRTNAYIAAGVPVIWLGLMSDAMKGDATNIPNGLRIDRYAARPWERWAHAYCFKELWFIDPKEQTLWRGLLSPYLIDVESTSWYNEDGEEESAGGYSRHSKRWKTLKLYGPTPISNVAIGIKHRKLWSSETMKLPGGPLAHFKHDS